MTVAIPGERDVRATHDAADGVALIVACPPHPEYGGSRRDSRLRAVAAALTERGVDCLRIDYGPWDGGHGEADDVAAALDWADTRVDRVGLFGYSFGAGVALRVAADRSELCGVSVLAPPATSIEDGDAATATADIVAPLQIVIGERDETVSWGPVVDAATASGAAIERVPGDHFFAGQSADIASTISTFLANHCTRMG
ncbi:MAG: alpha/beta hydrolase [Salinirussus sp.]